MMMMMIMKVMLTSTMRQLLFSHIFVVSVRSLINVSDI